MGNRVIEGLKANTSYNWYVRAKNVVGQWGPLSTVVASTTAQDTTAPAAPTGQAILIAVPNFFIIKWTLGSEKDLEEHRIYIYTSNTPASAKVIKRISGNTTKVNVNVGEATEDASITISAGTAYWFWITSVDKSGNESSKSTAVTGTLLTRITLGSDVTDDLIVDLATKGLVLKDTQGTPHYWRVTADGVGGLTITDIGTSKP